MSTTKEVAHSCAHTQGSQGSEVGQMVHVKVVPSEVHSLTGHGVLQTASVCAHMGGVQRW